jgi:hypothetical protein
MRRIIAKREVEYLMHKKIHLAKSFVAKKIQSYYKRNKAMKLLEELKK